MEKKVLIVEDNKMDQLINQKIIESLGASVSICDNGVSAVEMMLEQDFDLVILDLSLPIANGVQLMLGLKTASCEIDVPIIVVSGATNTRLRNLVEFLGAKEVISKPLNLERHKSIIKQYLSI